MSDTMNSDAYRITWLVRRLFRAMDHKTTGYLGDLGISVADRAVMEFIYPDRALSVPEIAKRYRVSRQHVQVTVNALLEKHLVSSRDNPGHKRSPLIVLEDRGRELFESILKRDGDVIDELFADVPQADRRQVRQTLEKMLDNID